MKKDPWRGVSRVFFVREGFPASTHRLKEAGVLSIVINNCSDMSGRPACVYITGAFVPFRTTGNSLSREKRGCRISKYFLLGGSPALCPNGIEIGHVFDAILYKRSSFPGIPFGMPDFRLFCFQLSKSMPFLMEKDNFPFFRSESCNEAY